MIAETTPDVASILEDAKSELEVMADLVETETLAVAKAFEVLAGQSDLILNLAEAIVGCVENEGVTSVLPKVHALGAAARQFVAERLQATTGILQTVGTEVKLLHQLSDVASSQEAIALEIKVLSVFTNIEVARLGAVGGGFQYLAHELADFSRSVIADTQELVSHTDSRRAAIEETRRLLSAELPRLREALARIEDDLGNALVAIDSSLSQLSETPQQFRGSVEEIARQIAGVVAALQSQDITRQMNEHVQAGLALVAARIRGATALGENEARDEFATIYAGLAIQVYQLRSVKHTVQNWITQIRTCLNSVFRISASDVVAIGPLVLQQESRVSAQLTRIELLERESQVYSGRIQKTLSGLSNLMQLLSEHLQRSKSIRDRLRLLAFNSIIEASHLGTRADVILAISKSIKEVSVAWGLITDQSALAMQEMLQLVAQTNGVIEVFSPAGNARLRDAQVQTRAGLDDLRSAAEFAGAQAEKMNAVTGTMQAKITEIGNKNDRLERCFDYCDRVLSQVENLKHKLEVDDPRVKERYDAREIEQLFAASYTTELEREVLRAALNGTALPLTQETPSGNSVELF